LTPNTRGQRQLSALHSYSVWTSGKHRTKGGRKRDYWGILFYVHVLLHHKSMYLEDQRDAILSSLYLLYCQVTLHVSSVWRTHQQEYTNCSYNHSYKSWI
jgi:hypothetical protein